MSQVPLPVRHLFPQSIRSHCNLKAKVQETFDVMKSKAEEEASRQRSGGLLVWLDFFIQVEDVREMSHLILSNSSYLITFLFLQLGDSFHSSEKNGL